MSDVNSFKANLDIARTVKNIFIKKIVERLDFKIQMFLLSNSQDHTISMIKQHIPNNLLPFMNQLTTDDFDAYKKGLKGENGYYPFPTVSDQKNTVARLIRTFADLAAIEVEYDLLLEFLGELDITIVER